MNTSAEIKKIKLHKYLLTALVMSAALWAWWALEHYTNLRLVRLGSSAREESVPTHMILIATVIIFVGSIIWWNRSAGIAKNGILLDAVVVNLGASGSGMCDATLKYTVDGKSYKVRKSFSEKSFGNCKQGETIQIVVDKRNPNRVILNN